MAGCDEMKAGFCSLYRDGQLLDYMIEVEGHEFWAHKAVLASMSGYFRVMLTNGMLESQHNRVELHGFSPRAVRDVIQFMYEKKFAETRASSDELFGLAMYLQVPSAVEVCTHLLYKEMTNDNCLDLLALFASHAVDEGVKKVQEFIKANVNLPLVLSAEEMVKLPLEVVSHLHDCWCWAEWSLFLTIREWIMSDYVNYKKHVDSLMSNIRFPLIPLQEVETVKSMSIYIDCPGPWYAQVESAIEYHNMPMHKKVLIVSDETMMRNDPSLVCFSVHEAPVPQFHEANKREWQKREDTWTPSLTPGVAAVQANNFLIVYNQQFSDRNTYIFDPRQCRWTRMASMTPKRDFGFVFHDNHLYAIGGRRNDELLDGIDRYDFQTNKWSAFSTLPCRLFKLAACSLDGLIYTSGGKYEMHGRDTNRLACYNPTDDTWQNKTPSRSWSDHTLHVMEVEREKVIAVVNYKMNLYYYHPATDQWRSISVLSGLPSNNILKMTPQSTVMARNNSLYLLNFTKEVDPSYREFSEDRNDSPVEGVCAKLTINTFKRKFEEYYYQPFPIEPADEDIDGKKNYCTALLAIKEYA